MKTTIIFTALLFSLVFGREIHTITGKFMGEGKLGIYACGGIAAIVELPNGENEHFNVWNSGNLFDNVVEGKKIKVEYVKDTISCFSPQLCSCKEECGCEEIYFPIPYATKVIQLE